MLVRITLSMAYQMHFLGYCSHFYLGGIIYKHDHFVTNLESMGIFKHLSRDSELCKNGFF